ncbi:MAG: response regulator transcription factor [Anaerolineae bacterium]|nr:response regulator transcription factor [Anaerolineae bacterium]
MSEENKGKILVIDDDKGLLRLVGMTLKAHGFQVQTADSGQKGLELFQQEPVDLVILDVMMPGLDGRTVCQRIRERSTIPILFLTARGQVQDRVEGLMMGADDYVVKPFNIQELMARIESLLRRTRMITKEPPKVLRFGGGKLVINRETFQVFANGEEVHLTPTEYQLLLYLAERAGRVYSVKAIYNAVWSYDSEADPKTVRWYIWRLRQKVEADASNPAFILTEPGVGYRFTTL